jgi:hypothetical protein
MTHYTVAVLLPRELKGSSIESFLAEQMHPYDEELPDNPDAKWDWYVIGGRWDGWALNKQSEREDIADNMAFAGEIAVREEMPFAIITPDGTWHELGDGDARRLLMRYAELRIVILDAHA